MRRWKSIHWVVSGVIFFQSEPCDGRVVSYGDFELLQRRTSATLASTTAGCFEAAFRMQDPEVHSVVNPDELQQVRLCQISWNGPDYWLVAKYDYLTSPSREAAVMSYPNGVPTTGTVILGRPDMLFAFREGSRRGSVRTVRKYFLNADNQVTAMEETAVYSADHRGGIPVEVSEFRNLLANGLIAGWTDVKNASITRSGDDAFTIQADSIGIYEGALKGRITATISDAGAVRSLVLDQDAAGYQIEVRGGDELQVDGMTFTRDIVSLRRYLNASPERLINIQMNLQYARRCGPDNAVKATVEAVFDTPEVRRAAEAGKRFEEFDSDEIRKIETP